MNKISKRTKIFQSLIKSSAESTTTLSATLRKLNAEDPKKAMEFLKKFKELFEKNLSQGLSTEELESAILAQLSL